MCACGLEHEYPPWDVYWAAQISNPPERRSHPHRRLLGESRGRWMWEHQTTVENVLHRARSSHRCWWSLHNPCIPVRCQGTNKPSKSVRINSRLWRAVCYEDVSLCVPAVSPRSHHLYRLPLQSMDITLRISEMRWTADEVLPLWLAPQSLSPQYALPRDYLWFPDWLHGLAC